MAYMLNDWTLSSPTHVSPQPGDPIGSQEYVIFNVPDLSVSPYTYITQTASSSVNGNSVEIVADLSDEDTNSYINMYIDDGTNKQGIKIYSGKVTLLDGTSETILTNTSGTFHRYTISMKQGVFKFWFDKNCLIEKQTTDATSSAQLFIGFTSGQVGEFIANFKYIKYAYGVYKYLIPSDLDFELQVDSDPSFNTVNLHTYTKSNFEHIKTERDAWDPVSYICGRYKEQAGKVTYTKIGTPTIVSSVVSNLSDANYLQVGSDVFNKDISEVVVKCTLDSNAIRQGENTIFYKTSDNISLTIPSTTTAFSEPTIYLTGPDQAYTFTDFIPTVDVPFWLKYTYSGTTARLYYSLNGLDYTLCRTITNVTVTGADGTFIIGKGSASGNYFSGSIDLTETFIKVKGSYWFRNNAYDGIGIVNSATITLPQKPDMQLPLFYYRVRTTNSDGETAFSQTYLVNKVKPQTIAATQDKISLFYTSADAGYHALAPLSNIGVALPQIPVADNWKTTLYNESPYTISIYDYTVGAAYQEEPSTTDTSNPYFVIQPYQIVSVTFDTADNKWYITLDKKRCSFSLFPDVTSEIFNAVYHYHIPSYDYVYTKVYDSGNIATLVHAEAKEIANVVSGIQTASENMNIFVAEQDTFAEKWSNVFNLDKSLFKNPSEMRDTFQYLINNLTGQMLKPTMQDVLYAVTGAAPDIIEYKDKLFNLLWSTSDNVPTDMRYYLYDNSHPSFIRNPFIVYNGAAKEFTFEIRVYDPYNLQYSQELIRQIILMFKPGWTRAVIKFYNEEGETYAEKYYYGIDNYIESAYTR